MCIVHNGYWTGVETADLINSARDLALVPTFVAHTRWVRFFYMVVDLMILFRLTYKEVEGMETFAASSDSEDDEPGDPGL